MDAHRAFCCLFSSSFLPLCCLSFYVHFKFPLVAEDGFEPPASRLCIPLQFSLPFPFVVWTLSSPSTSLVRVLAVKSLHLPISGLGSALPVKASPNLTSVLVQVSLNEALRKLSFLRALRATRLLYSAVFIRR